MKSFLTLGFLFFAIGAYLILPVVPIFDYLINKDYIAKNLCVNKDKPKSCCKGKCYLVKQLKKTSQHSSEQKNEPPKRMQFRELYDSILNNVSIPISNSHPIRYNIFLSLKQGTVYLQSVYVPPEPWLLDLNMELNG
jgi:hypothetical protein